MTTAKNRQARFHALPPSGRRQLAQEEQTSARLTAVGRGCCATSERGALSLMGRELRRDGSAPG